MDTEENKLFIGGISWETTEDKLREYFSNYGEVTQAVIMHDKTTGKPRGFGFVLFSDSSSIDSVLQHKHTLDGRLVEAKRALSREEQNARQQQSNAGRGFEGGGNIRTKKIFVGGLPPSITEEGFRQYFEQYGNVTDVVIMYDQSTQRPRGFGFVTFDSEDAVDMVLHKSFHELDGKDVEVKRALPKEASPASNNNRSGGYQNYGSSRNNSGSYDNRMDGNQYMQPQSGGNFSQYPGYNAAGYTAYGGPAGAYGGYGGYGMASYGAPPSGFTGPTGGYGSGSNAMKSGWNNQNPGYGSLGYGQGGGYGPGGGSAQTGHYPGVGQGYNNQAYGGGYGGNAYGSGGGQSGTGNANGADQTGSYKGSGYGDNRNAGGYGGSGWNSQAAGGYGDS